jgi:hypothetical protein
MVASKDSKRRYRRLPRQGHSSKLASRTVIGLGIKVRAGTRPRLSCGRFPVLSRGSRSRIPAVCEQGTLSSPGRVKAARAAMFQKPVVLRTTQMVIGLLHHSVYGLPPLCKNWSMRTSPDCVRIFGFVVMQLSSSGCLSVPSSPAGFQLEIALL